MPKSKLMKISYLDAKEFEEIDRKVSTPLIPEYKDYLLDVLKSRGILVPLTVMTCSMKFDAWALSCSQDDKNIGQVLEDGLKSGEISIPGSKKADKNVFERVGTVTQYPQTATPAGFDPFAGSAGSAAPPPPDGFPTGYYVPNYSSGGVGDFADMDDDGDLPF